VHAGAKRVVELFVKGLGPALRDLPLHRVADLGRHRRAQLQLGEGGAQVEAGAADHDRAAAFAEQLVDLAAGELGEAPSAELLVDVGDPDQAVLQPLALGQGRRRREGLEPSVDLQRVAGDRDGVLPALPEPLGYRDRNPGLPDRGRPEDR
jgi:hypothetical protein